MNGLYPGRDASAARVSTRGPVSEQEVVWSFVSSELDSTRWRGRLLSRLSPSLAAKVRSGDFSSASESDYTELKRALVDHRGRFVEGLLQPTTAWSSVNLDTSSLADLRVVAEVDFMARAPSRRLGEFVEGADSRARPIPDFDSPYFQIRAAFDPKRSRGEPILVARDPGGPFTIAEELTRLTCIVSLNRESKLQIGPIRTIVGVNPHLANWKWI